MLFKSAIFVAKTCKYGIFVAKIYKYAFNDSFLRFSGSLDSAASLAALYFSQTHAQSKHYLIETADNNAETADDDVNREENARGLSNV